VKTDQQMVLELQNSPMASIELHARETFYGRMKWVVNADKFRRFHILDPLPDPRCEFAQDLCFIEQRIDFKGKGYWRKSENPGSPELVLIHDMNEIENEIAKNYVGHHFYDWRHPRSVWFESSKPVYFDFGDQYVWQLQKYDSRGLCMVRAASRDWCLHYVFGRKVGAIRFTKPHGALSYAQPQNQVPHLTRAAPSVLRGYLTWRQPRQVTLGVRWLCETGPMV
jgi:hypothetical protein